MGSLVGFAEAQRELKPIILCRGTLMLVSDITRKTELHYAGFIMIGFTHGDEITGRNNHDGHQRSP
jgi:hypothetical protein